MEKTAPNDAVAFGPQGGRAFHRAIRLMAEVFSRRSYTYQDDQVGRVDAEVLHRMAVQQEKDRQALKASVSRTLSQEELRQHRRAIKARVDERVAVYTAALDYLTHQAQTDPELRKLVLRLRIRRGPSGHVERILIRSCW